MRPSRQVALSAQLETLHGQGIVSDQQILGLRFSTHKPGIEWVHDGLIPSGPAVVSALSADSAARTWRSYDMHHRLRLGSPETSLYFQGWSGRLASGGEGPQTDHSLGVGTLLNRVFPWGGASVDLGLAPAPLLQPSPATPLIDGMLHVGHRWEPYLGVSTALASRSILLSGRGSPGLQNRLAARLEAYTVLDNGRGTRLRPRISLRLQRLAVDGGAASSPLLGVHGEVFTAGFQARQSGFVHDYELLAVHRVSAQNDLRGLLLSWRGTWRRRWWSMYGHLLMDSMTGDPAVLTTSFKWKPKDHRQQFEIGYLRRHLGRDLTIDPDPWLGINQRPFSDEISGAGIYALVWNTLRWRNERWQFAATSALRPMTWTLNSIRLEGGYNSSCKCWGVTAYGGYSGEIRPGEVSATPFFGFSLHSGRSPTVLRQQVSGALGRFATGTSQ